MEGPTGPRGRQVKGGGVRKRRTPKRGNCRIFPCRGGRAPPREDNEYLPYFTSECANLFLKGVYGDFLHHNNRSHLDEGVLGDAVWQRHWRRMLA